MIVQIYGTKTVEDAEALVTLGVDYVGLEAEANADGQALMGQIVDRIRHRTRTVLLPLFTDPDAILRLIDETRPHVLHLCSADTLPLDEIYDLRAAMGDVRLLLTVPVGLPGRSAEIDSLGLAAAYQEVADILLLDTYAGDYSPGSTEIPGWIGVTGKTHDWAVSRQIVARCHKPVILAGGLDPQNVTAAIKAVRPWGVDSCTGTDLYRGKKDLDKVAAFVQAVRSWQANSEPCN
jgi:phosphoribosylanthranilate isomerase